MATTTELKPVGDDVSQVDGKIAVGEDLDFQRSWWRFEKIVWAFFTLILIADVSGILGRGPLANADAQTGDGTLRVKYERVLREGTSSIMTILPQASTVQNGRIQLFLSDSVLKELGAQRIIPQPETSTLGGGGVTYSFPVSGDPITIQIELKPSFVGSHRFQVGIPSGQSIQRQSVVLP